MIRRVLICLIIGTILLLGSCSNTMDDAHYADNNQNVNSLKSSEFTYALNDWINGSDFGIMSGSFDTKEKTVVLSFRKNSEITTQEEQDIESAVNDLLKHYNFNDGYTIIINNNIIDYPLDITQPAIASKQNTNTVNLIFIHHSCGENWLHDGLNKALNESGYHVADISYGWNIYGDNTDTTHWPIWFTDEVMNLVYNEKDTISASNTIAPSDGDNEVIMFKSCFPNSDVGNSIQDEKAIYDSLIPYFTEHPDKMFILITPPPMMHISNSAKTRELCNWLVDRDDGWLADLSTHNVFVFDFYNVLTHPDAHHHVIDDKEQHIYINNANQLYYDSSGDDHPNLEGNRKATKEFISLLKNWRQQYLE